MAVVEAIQSEYRAALEACALFDSSNREQLRVTGSEAVSFVHGMVTNDVQALAVGAHCYAALLTAKGSMVGDARILRRTEDVIIDTGPDRGRALSEFLNKYLISEDAEVHDAPELAVISLLGPSSGAVAAKIPADAKEGELWSFWGGVDVLLKRQKREEVLRALSEVPRLCGATLEVLRVEKGVPLYGVDMTEATIPLEANLGHAISYNKGCYIGQEVIARGTHRGQMSKKLMQLLLGEAAPEPKAELRVGERKVGWVTSVVKSVKYAQNLALGYVHRDFQAPGTKLELVGGVATVMA